MASNATIRLAARIGRSVVLRWLLAAVLLFGAGALYLLLTART